MQKQSLLRKLFIVAGMTVLVLVIGKLTEVRPLIVMSYNIRLGVANDSLNSWDNRKPATIAMLNDVNPDVFGVQEAYDFQVKYILDNCPRYKAVGVGREDGVSAGEHMSVFYDTTRVALKTWGTYWLSETPDVPSLGWDAACYRTATWALLRDLEKKKDFFFVNTHLDHVGKVARREGLALIYNRIRKMNPKGIPMVLTGDFNVLPDDPCLQDINTLMHSARFDSRQADAIGSFNGFGAYGNSAGAPVLDDSACDRESLRPLDYIYYSGFKSALFKVVTKTYLDIPYISDHYPVFAVLK